MRPVLITAGATRNPIDAMRFISANSSGRTGAYIAEALGAEGVLLLGSPEACLRAPAGCQTESYTDTLNLLALMKVWVQANPRGVVVHAAAVGDYMLDPDDEAATEKRPSGQAVLELRLVPTPKILSQIRTWSDDVFLVSFKAAPPRTEPAQLQEIATAQRDHTRSDLVFANTIGALDSQVLLLSAAGATRYTERESALQALTSEISASRRR